MSEQHDPIRVRCIDLLARARDDLRMAELALGEEPCPAWAAAFHAQQAAEKSIKAFLVLRSIDVPFTHDLRLLVDLIPVTIGWRAKLESASELTAYATTTRYVIRGRDVSKRQACSAHENASRIVEVIVEQLRTDGLDV